MEYISHARAFIYCFAILWIMLFHSSFPFRTPVMLWLQDHGNCGVDIFFLLSGVSLYFSYSKNKNAKKFYANRLYRTLPYFIAVYGLYFLVCPIMLIILNGGGAIFS